MLALFTTIQGKKTEHVYTAKNLHYIYLCTGKKIYRIVSFMQSGIYVFSQYGRNIEKKITFFMFEKKLKKIKINIKSLAFASDCLDN